MEDMFLERQITVTCTIARNVAMTGLNIPIAKSLAALFK